MEEVFTLIIINNELRCSAYVTSKVSRTMAKNAILSFCDFSYTSMENEVKQASSGLSVIAELI